MHLGRLRIEFLPWSLVSQRAKLYVAGFWAVFYTENKRFALDTLRVASRSPTPASKINDFPALLDDIWGVRGRRSRPIWAIPHDRAGIRNRRLGE